MMYVLVTVSLKVRMRILKAVMASALLAIVVSGCTAVERITGGSDECKATKASASITFDGLTWPKSPTEPVKIGKFTYTPAEAKSLSNAVSALENYRLGHCTNMRTLAGDKNRLPNSIADAVKGYNTTYIVLFMQLSEILNTGATPEKVVKTADRISADAKKASEELKKAAGAPQTAVPPIFILPDSIANLSEEFSKVRTDVQILKSRIFDLEGSLNKSPITTRHVIVVQGFANNSVALPAKARQNLADEVLRFIRENPSSTNFKATLIGFADPKGSQILNLDLGIRRARHVAELLTQLNYFVEIENVASGGILNNAANARRVEIAIRS